GGRSTTWGTLGRKMPRSGIWSPGLRRAARPSMTRRRRLQMSSRAANPNGRKRQNCYLPACSRPSMMSVATSCGESSGTLAKQREFSEQIRSTILQLRELQDRPDADQGRIDELTNRVEWDTRIFEERGKTMNFVCEVPVLIEQRLFALARAIQQSLE